jgi:hypothetical protein
MLEVQAAIAFFTGTYMISFATSGCCFLSADPNPFFRALLKRQYRGRVVLVPLIVSFPSPSGQCTSSGAGATARGHPEHVKLVDTSVTYLARHGFCLSPDNCQRFPVAFKDFKMGQASAHDLQDFVTYLEQEGVRTESLQAGGSWFLWNFNCTALQTGNSTGSIVMRDG